MAANKNIYQFKISLYDFEPLIWRRIHISETATLWDLHVAIQDAMGWKDCHLHLFSIKRAHARKPTLIGIPGEDDWGPVLPGWQNNVSAFCSQIGQSMTYEYDFGDGWRHKVLLEGYLIREKNMRYPRCLAGARACPPEDCGGIPGYHRLLTIVSDKRHPEHDEMMTWLGGSFEPDAFSPESVRFRRASAALADLLG